MARRSASRPHAGPKVSVAGIYPYLWFDDQAEPAARLYVSLFRNSRITAIHRYPNDGGGAAGRVMTVEFELAGRPFLALNGGPHFRFNEAVSFFIRCRTQRDVDRLWAALSKGGKKSRCGWLVDRFGLSWQVIPERLGELLSDPDEERAGRVFAAMMRMSKIEVPKLERAYRGP